MSTKIIFNGTNLV